MGKPFGIVVATPYCGAVMFDFPPQVPEFSARPDTATRRVWTRDFSDPDTRSPARFLGWLMWQQWPSLIVASLVAVVEFLPGAVGPFLIGQVIDRGISPRDLGAVWFWSMLLLGTICVGIGFGILRHTMIVGQWLKAMYGSMKLVTRKTTQMGHVQLRRVPAGEVLSVSGGDSDMFGALCEVATRAAGALIAYLVVAGLVLSTSVQLGIVVLVAAPVLVAAALPLLKPLQRRQAVERARLSELTSLATDIVAGLRILRGIGGEQTFARNYAEQSQVARKAGVASGTLGALVDATAVLFSGLLLVVLTWLGAVIGLFIVGAAADEEVFSVWGVLHLIFGWIVPFLSVVLFRVVLEAMIAQIRTAQQTAQLVRLASADADRE